MSGSGTSFDDESGFSTISVEGSSLGNMLADLLMAPDIQPGETPSYQVCKVIYLYHPLGAKIAEKPISMAQAKPREIEVKDAPGERIKDKFLEQWEADQGDFQVFQGAVLSRVYGVAGVAVIIAGEDPSTPLDYWSLANKDIEFNILDPLNMAGSFTTAQNPNDPDFMKLRQMRVAGQRYHPSRYVTKINEQPIYLGWTNAAFGYVGRPVYQRALYPLKSFISTMITDDMVARKAGLLIAKIKGPGSIVNRIAAGFAALKRQMLKLGRTGNVVTIGLDESVETLDMVNIDGAMNAARKDILENIAAAVPMPALLLNDETMGGNFHEGSEDAYAIAAWVDVVRKDLKVLYAFMDRIIQHRAWTPEFYVTIQKDFPEYKNIDYEVAFYKWRNTFTATWPEIIKEPESDQIKVEQTKLGGMFEAFDKLLPLCDPYNKGELVDWVVNNINEMQLLFPVPLILEVDKIVKMATEAKQQMDDMQQQTIEGQAEEQDDDESDSKPSVKSTVVPMPKKIGANR